MANRRFEMYEYRQVLSRLRLGESSRAISRAGLMGRRKVVGGRGNGGSEQLGVWKECGDAAEDLGNGKTAGDQIERTDIALQIARSLLERWALLFSRNPRVRWQAKQSPLSHTE